MHATALRLGWRAAGCALLAGIATLAPALPPASGRAAAAGRKAADLEAPTGRWREGPVRYLLSKDEDDAFRALDSDAERARFIQAFWAGRDPDPTTPENEYRARFYRRVQEADRLFAESTTHGWKTDRGKIYILLGPPDDFERSSPFDRGRAADVILWTYRDPPPGVALGGDSTLRFVRDPSGEYRISSPVRITGPWMPLAGRFQVQALQMKSLPEQHQVLDRIVQAGSFLDAAPIRTRGDSFRAADGKTFILLTLGVRRDALQGPPATTPRDATAAPDAGAPAHGPGDPRLEVVARLVGEDPGTPDYDLAGPTGLHPVRAATPGDPAEYLLFQGGSALAPGRYTIYYGVVDRDSGRVYSFREALAVPDFRGGGLLLSSVTLADGLEGPPGGPATAESPAPFALGNLRVRPRADDAFRNGEVCVFYYQIYGPTTDPINGRPDLDLEYQFFAAESVDAAGRPVFVPLGQPIRLTGQQSPVQAYSFPLKDWAPATYRLRVRVTDNLDGRQSAREVTFRVL